MTREVLGIVSDILEVVTALIAVGVVVRFVWTAGDRSVGWRARVVRWLRLPQSAVPTACAVTLSDIDRRLNNGLRNHEKDVATLNMRLADIEQRIETKIETCQECLTMAAERGGVQAANAAQKLVHEEVKSMKKEIHTIHARVDSLHKAIDDISNAWGALGKSHS